MELETPRTSHEYDALGKEAMHEMMAEKGFVRRTEEEIREVGEAAERRKKEDMDDKIRRAKEKNELRECDEGDCQ